MAPKLLKAHFQMGYAVRDMDCAIAVLRHTFGIAHWQVMRLPPDAPSQAIAFAYVDNTMIELVQPTPGKLKVFDNWVPEDKNAMTLHHFGHLVESEEEWDVVSAWFSDRGIAVADEGRVGDLMSFRYYDTVGQLGHYCEFVHLKPKGKNFWSQVPKN